MATKNQRESRRYMEDARKSLFPTYTQKSCDANKGIRKKEKSKKKVKNPKKVILPKPPWNLLPDIVLEEIFERLTIRQRYYASQVCRDWYAIFFYPRVWNTFVLEDHTLTRRKYNYYMGYQYVLDHQRTQLCLNHVGRYFRRIIIKPMENFFNLYEFMTIVTYFCEFFEDEPLSLVHTLHFTFKCATSGENVNDREARVFGTGGKMLEALKRMVGNFTGLRHLSLENLLLDKEEAKYLLDDVAYNCCETMRTLKLVNCTKDAYTIFHAGVFINLQKLTISPQHLGEEVVLLFAYTRLKDMYILQTKYTEEATPVPAKAWRECRKRAPWLNVHLKIEGKIKKQLVWQEGAPVRSIIYDTPYSRATTTDVQECINLYSDTLQVYAHLGLPRYHMDRKLNERVDYTLMLITQSFPNLRTLVIRELVSSGTILMIALRTPNLKNLIVRRNALLKKCGWPPNPNWSEDFYSWLTTTSKQYESTMQEVSRVLGRSWSPLSDREFKEYRL